MKRLLEVLSHTGQGLETVSNAPRWRCGVRQLTFSGGQWLGEDAIRKQVLHVPLRCALGLPGPEDPASSLLVSIKLRLDEVSDVVLVDAGEGGNSSSRLASAVTDLRRTGESTIVTRTLVLSVEPLRTVGQTTGPLSCDGVLASASHLITEVTGHADVTFKVLRDHAVVEDFVVVGIEKQVPHARAPVAPGCNTLEGIVEGDSNVGVLEVTPAVHVELANSVHIHVRAKRLVEQLDGRNSGMRCVIIADFVQYLQSVLDRVALTPSYAAVLARVVEAIL